MKKEYQKPVMKAIEINAEQTILASSTPDFGARMGQDDYYE